MENSHLSEGRAECRWVGGGVLLVMQPEDLWVTLPCPGTLGCKFQTYTARALCLITT